MNPRQEEHDPPEPETGDEMSTEQRARLHAFLWKSLHSGVMDPPFPEESEDDGPTTPGDPAPTALC